MQSDSVANDDLSWARFDEALMGERLQRSRDGDPSQRGHGGDLLVREVDSARTALIVRLRGGQPGEAGQEFDDARDRSGVGQIRKLADNHAILEPKQLDDGVR